MNKVLKVYFTCLIILACFTVLTTVIAKAELNYKQAIYRVQVDSDGSDYMNAQLMREYGFDDDGGPSPEPKMYEKIVAWSKGRGY